MMGNHAYRSLPFAPLEEHLARRRGRLSDARLAAALGVQRWTVHRWREKGQISIRQADESAIAVGLHPLEVWGQAWLEVPDARA